MSIKIFGTVPISTALLLNGCSQHIPPGSLAAPAVSSRLNTNVHWGRPEFLYGDASWHNSDPLAYRINSDGTLASLLTQYDINNDEPAVPAQYETYIAGLTVSPGHRFVYFADFQAGQTFRRVGRYRAGRAGLLDVMQMYTESNKTLYPKSISFTGHGRCLYIMYNQYSASNLIPNRYLLVAYHSNTDGRFKRLPGLPITAATYTTAAFLANQSMVPAYALTGPSPYFLYVMRPQDQHLDICEIGSDGKFSPPPISSLALGYRPGKAMFSLSGHILYIADADHSIIAAYRVGTHGLPVRLPGTVPGTDLALDPQGRFLYAPAPGNHAMHCYSILPDGTLHLQGTTPTRDLCFAPCVDTTGRFVYAIGQNPSRYEPTISQFRIMGNGTLMPLQPEEVPAVGCTTLVAAQ